jgi:ABC-type nitrate/sulfonate/bicarbonate transport system substrate-binding protein
LIASRRLAVLAALLTVTCGAAQSPPLQKITINYATRTGTSWPLYIAKEAGYFQKYGLDVDIAFAVHPAGIATVISGEAVMTNYPLEQAMMAGSRGGSVVILGSPYRKSTPGAFETNPFDEVTPRSLMP